MILSTVKMGIYPNIDGKTQDSGFIHQGYSPVEGRMILSCVKHGQGYHGWTEGIFEHETRTIQFWGFNFNPFPDGVTWDFQTIAGFQLFMQAISRKINEFIHPLINLSMFSLDLVVSDVTVKQFPKLPGRSQAGRHRSQQEADGGHGGCLLTRGDGHHGGNH
jgi:hypothetical protein